MAYPEHRGRYYEQDQKEDRGGICAAVTIMAIKML